MNWDGLLSICNALTIWYQYIWQGVSPADLLCSHLAQYPSQQLPSSFQSSFLSLEAPLNWILSEPSPNLLQLIWGSTISWNFYLFNMKIWLSLFFLRACSLAVLFLLASALKLGTDLGLAIPFFIPKHVRNITFGSFSACHSLCIRCCITSMSLWKMTCIGNPSLIL